MWGGLHWIAWFPCWLRNINPVGNFPSKSLWACENSAHAKVESCCGSPRTWLVVLLPENPLLLKVSLLLKFFNFPLPPFIQRNLAIEHHTLYDLCCVEPLQGTRSRVTSNHRIACRSASRLQALREKCVFPVRKSRIWLAKISIAFAHG